MKCPKCDRVMGSGYVFNGIQPIQWIPENRKPSGWRGGVAEDAVALPGGSFWNGYRAEAFYCYSCKMVILPVQTDR